MKCIYCNKECKSLNSLKQHEIRCKLNENRKISIVDYSKRKSSNQYIKAKENNLIYKLSDEAKQRISDAAKKRTHTELTKKKLSEIARKNELGGHTSKNRKWYTCKDGSIVNLHSDYEIQVAKSLDENNISWIRPSYILWTDDNNVSHRYYPDFYLKDYDVYLDPKNDYLISKDRNKIEKVCLQNNIKVYVLNKHQLNWQSIASVAQLVEQRTCNA